MLYQRFTNQSFKNIEWYITTNNLKTVSFLGQ